MGSIPASMMGMTKLEAANFINPDLRWKPASKGSRSGRSRKPFARGSKMDWDLVGRNPRRESDSIVTESEKLGVAVLGRRFSEKTEHVPIKKRRFMVRSPSPPPFFSSSHIENNEQCIDLASNQQFCPKLIGEKESAAGDDNAEMASLAHIDKRSLGMANEKLGNEDFSGIEILAAAACNNSIIDDADYGDDTDQSAREGSDRSTSGFPLEETTTSLETANSSTKDMVCDETKGSFQDSEAKSIYSEKEYRSTEGSVPLRDDRLHWDLNVPMDVWGQPCGDPCVDHQTNNAVSNSVGHKLSENKVCEVQKKFRDAKREIPTELQAIVEQKEHKLEMFSGVENIDYESFQSNNALQSTTYVGIETNISALEEDRSSSLSDMSVLQMKYNASGLKLDKVKLEREVAKPEIVLPCAPVSESAACEIVSTIKLERVIVENSETASRSPATKCSAFDIVSTLKEHGENPITESGLLDDPEFSQRTMIHGFKAEDNCQEESSLSAESVGVGEPVAMVDAKVQVHTANKPDSPVHVGSENVVHKSRISSADPGGRDESTAHRANKYDDDSATGLEKAIISDPDDENCKIGVSQENDNVFGLKNSMEAQGGYESQYEDGEFRESEMHYWARIEDEDMEIDCVDYDSDDCDTSNKDAVTHYLSGRAEMGSDHREERFSGATKNVEKAVGPGSYSNAEKSGHSVKGDTREFLLRSRSNTKAAGFVKPIDEVTDGNIMHTTNPVLGPDDKDFHAKAVGPEELMMELSCDEESLSSGLQDKKHGMLGSRMRSENIKLFPQAEKEADVKHSVERSISELDFWDSEPYYSHGSGRQRPKSVIETRGCLAASEHSRTIETVGVAGPGIHSSRQSMNFVRDGIYRTFRERSLAHTGYAYNLQKGVVPVRDANPDRRNFRRYQHGYHQGCREEHRRFRPDDPSDYNMPHRMARRERTISPSGREPLNYARSYRKSESRSRSHSPSWIPTRQRNEDLKHHSSRSPDFRFVGRIQRVSLPFQKPSFPAEKEMRFCSVPRRRFSPQQNSRWFDDQQSAPDHFRDRRLPSRMFRRSHRFDSVHRKLNSHDYFESLNPGRLTEMSSAGGGHSIEGSGEVREKYGGGRYEIIPRERHCDSGGVKRRFRHDTEDNFASYNSHGHGYDVLDKVGDRRPRDGRRSNLDKSLFRYNHDRVYNSSPNSFTMQDS